MSAPDRQIVFTANARADFTEILLYTFEQWGADRRDRYSTELTKAIYGLISYPNFGESRNDVSPGLRVRTVESHAIYYRVFPAEILIVRVLHQRMNAARAIGTE